MRRFYIVTNEKRDKDLAVTKEVQKLIGQAGGEVILATEILPEEAFKENIDCIITLGGDGTLIRAASILSEYGVPFLGINVGHLGYLTEIERDHLEDGITQLVTGQPHIEERMMLCGKKIAKDSLCDSSEMLIPEELRTYYNDKNMQNGYTALNDIVLTCKGTHRIIAFDVYINGQFLHSYKADGLIISTPTGSTGYSMSAGGPIVEPTARLIVMTPICAHSLHGRSIVLSATDTIEVVLNTDYDNRYEGANVNFDGDNLVDIAPGEKLRVAMADKSVKMWKLNTSSFLETMRRKMEG